MKCVNCKHETGTVTVTELGCLCDNCMNMYRHIPKVYCPECCGRLMEPNGMGYICAVCGSTKDGMLTACRPGAHQSMFEEILEKLNKHDLEIGALFTAKDGASAQRDELLERIGKEEQTRLELYEMTVKLIGKHTKRLEKLEETVEGEQYHERWHDYNELKEAIEFALGEQNALAGWMFEHEEQLGEVEKQLRDDKRANLGIVKRLEKVETMAENNEAAILVRPTGDYVDEKLHTLEKALESHGHNIPGRGLVTQPQHSSFSTIPPDSAWWMEGCERPEPDPEELACFAQAEYYDALGIAVGDYTPYHRLPEHQREAWIAAARAIVDEVRRG